MHCTTNEIKERSGEWGSAAKLIEEMENNVQKKMCTKQTERVIL